MRTDTSNNTKLQHLVHSRRHFLYRHSNQCLHFNRSTLPIGSRLEYRSPRGNYRYSDRYFHSALRHMLSVEVSPHWFRTRYRCDGNRRVLAWVSTVLVRWAAYSYRIYRTRNWYGDFLPRAITSGILCEPVEQGEGRIKGARFCHNTCSPNTALNTDTQRTRAG